MTVDPSLINGKKDQQLEIYPYKSNKKKREVEESISVSFFKTQ